SCCEGLRAARLRPMTTLFGRVDEDTLRAWARRLGELATADQVLLFCGPMGAGKTTFTRAFAEGLRVDAPEQVCSPTYTVCMTHPGRLCLVHLDLFRFGELGN